MGDLYIKQAGITQLAADAVVYSTDPRLGGNGQLYSAFLHPYRDPAV